ncbi:DNA polymerase III subunit psi [Candidatus Blochmannia ocreatus (nom. nud.)]|uniref:DNA polymerase III subunit psi n=1 Tax=Candidatus Blochmannia ocreatus (nom. nud.) TaxID=251538 RepID=A0ABY4SUP2_9ENTR|nr:DNA polymerase III subunit psi [Candidatus Blochmannia ocreatus]URJ25193.1 DNA polymerase III subunit psi [Candidatus Blochmannia ocreatus]
MNMLINNNKKAKYAILAELNIVLWRLRYPITVKNKILLKFWINTRLLLISSTRISIYDSFIKDVIHAMQLNSLEVKSITIKQFKNLIFPKNFFCHSWWIDTAVLYKFRGMCINTVSLLRLRKSARLKCALWEQIRYNINSNIDICK